MILLKLAVKSLRNRRLTTCLTILSITLSVALLLTIERAHRAAELGFTQTISRTDLIVGARSGSLQLLMYTVFNIGTATHNITYDTYEKYKTHPQVAWTVPYSLGDSHKGFRVIGTTNDFFKHYHFRNSKNVEFSEGHDFRELWDVVVGSQVARNLNYKIGSQVVVAHGVTKGLAIQEHGEKPFVVNGILKPTGTAIDRSVYISLKGMEAIHMDWQEGIAPTGKTAIAKENIDESKLEVKAITSFFLGAKSRIYSLQLQREINANRDEPLMAIIPGVVLNELWQGMSYVEGVLRFISWVVIGVGLVSMLIALMTSLNERRREMSILRAIGASGSQIAGLLVFESTLLTMLGVASGTAFSVLSMALLSPWLESRFGLYLAGEVFTFAEVAYLGVTLVLGFLIGLVPAIKAQQQALKDGLSIKV